MIGVAVWDPAITRWQPVIDWQRSTIACPEPAAILQLVSLCYRYLPMGGLKDFNQVSIALAYGEDARCIAEGRVAAVQSLSGTGSCRLMAEFMTRFMPKAKVSRRTEGVGNPFRTAGIMLLLSSGQHVEVLQME